jgi:hypothetical protein
MLEGLLIVLLLPFAAISLGVLMWMGLGFIGAIFNGISKAIKKAKK